ncbi:hypothetical protein [Nonomuraea salmonea]|uniref:ATP dependent DNA ligase n=1 Tax=Nonomuraea salmonea TaxID=46181 RepID=UPI0031EB697B
MPREHARDAHWVRPELVGEVQYAEVTGDGRLRHPRGAGCAQTASRPRPAPPDCSPPPGRRRRGLMPDTPPLATHRPLMVT